MFTCYTVQFQVVILENTMVMWRKVIPQIHVDMIC